MKKILRFGFYSIYFPVARIFLWLERFVSWKENRFWIENIPSGVFTGLAFENYTNWLYHQGYFSALVSCYFDRANLSVLDFGCGMGKYAPVCQFFTRDGGKYLGIDTDSRAIEQCRRTYGNLKNCEFFLTQDQNTFYKKSSQEQGVKPRADWPVQNSTQDLLICISVFTHLQEEEARLYMRKIYEVLVPGGIAIISFHVVRGSINRDNPIFNFSFPLTPGWYTGNPQCPEHAIAVETRTIQDLCKDRFTILRSWEGSSTGGKSSFFQDLFILKKL